MRKILICVLVVLTACGAGFAKSDKYSRPHYRADADLARKHPRSLSKGAAGAVVAGTNRRAGTKPAPKLDQQLKQLEMQNAKAAGKNEKGSTKAASGGAVKLLPEQKNTPINFRYAPPKNSNLQNHAVGNTSAAPLKRKLR